MMLAIPSSFIFISLALLFSHGARAAVLKSPRTVDLNALCNTHTPSTLASPTSALVAHAPPALPSSSMPSVNSSTIVPLHQEGQQQQSPPSPPPPSPPSTLALAVETSTAAIEAAEVDMGNIPYEESVTTTCTRVPGVAAAAAAMMTTAAPSASPPPVDPDAAREFQEAYGDRYTQTTYWSCQTEGVFKGHCGWHEPIIEIAAAASSGAGERRRGPAALALALRAGVVATGAVVVGGAAFAL
ncbi:hypothetical protein SLS62_004006 [Diatrype stigma]|uniref:Uncharacterized protein n=1 Tax=Diatrype stigma TaxID=117547 RepID=A0AAN9URC3_9PEZI